jgi:hypothetical protein
MANSRTRNDKANCIGQEPRTFDLEDCYPDALAICETCTVRSWCLNLVDPANNWYEGVVGGHIWSGGKPVANPNRHNDPVLANYLSTVPHEVKTMDRPRSISEPDELAITGLMAGDIPWKKLTVAERKVVAVRMWAAGAMQQEIADLTHLNTQIIQSICRGDDA